MSGKEGSDGADASSKPSEDEQPLPLRKAARKRTAKKIFEPETSAPVVRKKKRTAKPEAAAPPPRAKSPKEEPPKQESPKPESPKPESPTMELEVPSSPRLVDDHTTMAENPLAGVYAPLLRLRHKRQMDSTPLIPLPPRTIGGVRDQLEKIKHCTCRRSKCLMLYCDCFQSGLYCNPDCHCMDCRNIAQHAYQRNRAIDETLMRNKHSFRPRLLVNDAGKGPPPTSGVAAQPQLAAYLPNNKSNSRPPLSGCNCKKSSCLKKYCECFHAAVYCSPANCRCVDCQNKQGNLKRELLINKRRDEEKVVAAAAALAHQHSRLSGRMAMMGEAGRAYYHTAGTQEKDVEATRAAAAMAAGVAAEGVDLCLPPSSYATPLKLYNGFPYAGLAFGTAGPLKRKTPTPSRTKIKKKKGYQYYSKCETELQHLWRMEQDRVVKTFQKVATNFRKPPSSVASSVSPLIDARARITMGFVREDVQRLITHARKAETQAIEYLGGMKEEEEEVVERKRPLMLWRGSETERDPSSEQAKQDKTTRDSSGESDAPIGGQEGDLDELGDQMDQAVKKSGAEANDGQDVRASAMDVDEPDVETHAKASVSVDTDGPEAATESAADLSNPGVLDESALVCDETIDNMDERTFSDEALRQLTILAAQDTAIMRQLTSIIRRKTLKLAETRIRVVNDALRK